MRTILLFRATLLLAAAGLMAQASTAFDATRSAPPRCLALADALPGPNAPDTRRAGIELAAMVLESTRPDEACPARDGRPPFV